MNSQQYEQFTQTLQQTLEADARVLALVALGSMAHPERRDQWSDHDFWVITQPGGQAAFLDHIAWLPQHTQVALALRPAPHYYTVLYHDGHIVEFAVFDKEQVANGKLNQYQVLFDRGNVAARLDSIQASTRESQQITESDAFIFGYFLVNTWVGVQRFARGEQLSAHRYVAYAAINDLLILLIRHLPAERPDLRDGFDTRRYFERVYPGVGARLDRLLCHAVPSIALGLLDIADELLAPAIPDYPQQTVETLRQRIETLYNM